MDTVDIFLFNYTGVFDASAFRCMKKTYNCTLNDPFDPDVAGIGVVVSFLATAVITAVAILYGYIRQILPGVHMNRADELLFSTLKSKKSKPGPSSASESGRSLRKQKQLEDAMERFILSLSDQQLITGAAVLIAGFAKCDISNYSQATAAALAWFSCTTHLATLVVLRRYLRTYTAVRVWRVVGMLLVACLIVPSQVLAVITGRLSNICFYCSLPYIKFSYIPSSTLMQIIFVMFYLVYSYFQRVTALYIDLDPNDENATLSTLAGIRVQEHDYKLLKLKDVADGSGDILYLLYIACVELFSSFLGTICSIVFMATYGLAQTIEVWISFSPGRDMGFGQLVPLFLLVLPILAVLEVVNETTNDTSETETNELQPLVASHASIPSIDTSVQSLTTSADSPSTTNHVARSSTFDMTLAEEGIQRRRTGTQAHPRTTTGATATPTSPLSSGVLLSQVYTQPRFRSALLFFAIVQILAAVSLGIVCGIGIDAQAAAVSSASYVLLVYYVVAAVIILLNRFWAVCNPQGAIRKAIRAKREAAQRR